MQTTATVHMNKGYISREHLHRSEELCKHEKHIDLYNEQGNSEFEVWNNQGEVIDKSDLLSLRDIYAGVLGEAIADYNKGRRKDRQITVESYMQSIVDNKQGNRQTKCVNGKRVINEDSRQGKQLEYEFTVRVGNTEPERDEFDRTKYDRNQHKILAQHLPRDLQKRVLKRYAAGFSERNFNEKGGFMLTGIFWNADEGYFNKYGVWEYGGEHCHFTYIPFAENNEIHTKTVKGKKIEYTQGLKIENSMNKALKAIGINGSNGYEQWSSREQEVLGKILKEEYEIYCKENPDFYRKKGDLEIIHPVADKLKEGGLEKEEYISKQEKIDDIGNEAYEKFNGAIQQDNIKLQHTKRQLNADVALKRSELAQIQTEINQKQNDKNELQSQLQAIQVELQALQEEKSEYIAFKAERKKKREKQQQQVQKAENLFGEVVNIHSHKKRNGRNISIG